MIYRLWLIWEKNYYIIVIPTLLVCAESVFGFLAPAREALGQFQLLQTTVNILLCFNTSLQVVITVLITWRLLSPQVMNTLPQAQRKRRFQIVKCIVESGAMITVALVMDLALFAQHINFHWVFNISLAQLYSLNTVLIVLRLNSILKNNTGSSPGISTNQSQGGVGQRSYVAPFSPGAGRVPVSIQMTRAQNQQYVNIDPLDEAKAAADDYDSSLDRNDIEMAKYPRARRAGSPEALQVHVLREQDVYSG
jgi:hypothetical protein